MLKFIIIAAVLFVLWKIFSGFKSAGFSTADILTAGTGGGIAKNTSILYEKIRHRRPDLTENQARYLAMYINSNNARDDISVELLQKLVAKHAADTWISLCTSYAIEYWERVGREDITGLSYRARETFYYDIQSGIQDGKDAAESGNPLYDEALRILNAPSFLRDILADCPDIP